MSVTTSRKRSAIGSAAALILLVGLVFSYRAYYLAPPFKVAPLPKNARTLTSAEVDEILSANFQVIRRVQQIPPEVKADYTTLSNEPFTMVNPGQKRSTDGIIPGVPNKKLVLVGLAGERAVLIFKRGGLEDTTNAAVFSHRGNGGVWTARLRDNSVQDIPTLRDAVHSHRFEPWDANFLFANP
ncbi:MAG: hypothetical protein JST28_10225 [Acidobacteria bacterium]|nr:hypothetical protein [Acidobacteriota bacterium]